MWAVAILVKEGERCMEFLKEFQVRLSMDTWGKVEQELRTDMKAPQPFIAPTLRERSRFK